MHALEPDVDAYPAMHAVHTPAVVAPVTVDAVPAEQDVHAVECVLAAYVPGVHCPHAVSDVGLGEAVPVGHDEHEYDAPDGTTYVPDAHEGSAGFTWTPSVIGCPIAPAREYALMRAEDSNA